MPNRRLFLKSSCALGIAATTPAFFPARAFSALATSDAAQAAAAPAAGAQTASTDPNDIVGPRPGFSPQIGTLVSMMGFMRAQVLRSTKPLSQNDLDFLLDAKANTIGALLLHLVATEKFYQLNAFEGKSEKAIPDSWKEQWGPALELGDPGRKLIKGHPLDFYISQLTETREHTIAEFKKRDDAYLAVVDKDWGWNNHAKWFHVTEHEANHNGQIKFLKARLPGAKPATE